MEDNRMNLEEDMLPGEEEAMDQFDLTDDSFDDVTLESQGWEYVDSKDVYDEDGFRDVYYWYKKDGLHRFFFSSDVDYGDPEYFDWETESDEAAEEWFNTYDLQESLTEDFLRVNGKSYPIKDKSFLNGKKASYGNEHGLEHIMVVTKGDKKYDIYDSGFGNMSHADRCAILKEEFEDDDCTLEDIADQVEVNTPLHRDAPKPYPENYLINETSFADEMRAKYYEARVEDGVIKLSWITQEPFDETDVEAFKEELERFFEYTIEVSGYTKPVQVDVEVKCRDGAEEGYAEFTMRFQDKPVENITEEKEAKPAMTFTEFLNNCIAGGGNWAAMLMSGIKKVFPDKYAEMEDRQYTFEELLNIISECGVKVDEDSDDIQEGISDNMSAEDIAKKHDVPVEDIKAQLEKGIKVEKEHTDDEKKAERIALDHLF